MTCKDCIHSGLCYKENDYENFPDRCGSFVPERQQGEWIIDKNGDYICNQCSNYPLRNDDEELTLSNFCPNCGAKMGGGAE